MRATLCGRMETNADNNWITNYCIRLYVSVLCAIPFTVCVSKSVSVLNSGVRDASGSSLASVSRKRNVWLISRDIDERLHQCACAKKLQHLATGEMKCCR